MSHSRRMLPKLVRVCVDRQSESDTPIERAATDDGIRPSDGICEAGDTPRHLPPIWGTPRPNVFVCLWDYQGRTKFPTPHRRSPALAHPKVPDKDRTVSATTTQDISILRLPRNTLYRLCVSSQSGEPVLMTDRVDNDRLVARGGCDVIVARVPLQIEYGIGMGSEHGSLRFCVDSQCERVNSCKSPYQSPSHPAWWR